MAEHDITSEDTTVRGRPGTVARCLCGWSSSWGVQDGSAEADGHNHMMRLDPEYRQRWEERRARFLAEHKELMSARAPTPAPISREKPELCHECSCHLNPPCGACENCNHASGDITDCPNDCQECEVDHD